MQKNDGRCIMSRFGEYDDLKKDFSEFNANAPDVLRFRQNFQEEIEELEEEIEDLSCECQKIRLRLMENHNNDDGMPPFDLKLVDLQARMSERDDRYKDYVALSGYVDEFIRNNGIFDKSKCLSNLRFYLGESDAKIGQIEKRAGVQKGYLSRIDKANNTTEPGIQFLTIAANMLNVSLDSLIFGNPKELSEAEKYIYGLFCDLLMKAFYEFC